MPAKRSSTEFALRVVVLAVLIIVPARYSSAAETAEPSSWTKWASDKFSEEMGLRQENARAASGKIKEKAGDIAAKAKDALWSAAEYVFYKAGEVRDSVSDVAGNVVRIMRPEVSGDDEAAAGPGERAYEGAKQGVAESGKSAGDDTARRSYEAAKEESQAAGDMGAEMQEMMAKEL